MWRALVLALLLGGPVLGDEASDRKARSIAVLRAQGVPVLPSLPMIEDKATSHRRTSDEVARRTIALAVIAVTGETLDADVSASLTDQFQAQGYFSPEERRFLGDLTADPQDRINAAWRYEGVHVLLWALGIYDVIGRPDTITDVPLLASTLRELGAEGLFAQGQLRSQAELLDAADLMYRYHWAVMQARLDGVTAPAGLDPSVVQERRYALEWLITNVAWDDVSTDT